MEGDVKGENVKGENVKGRIKERHSYGTQCEQDNGLEDDRRGG